MLWGQKTPLMGHSTQITILRSLRDIASGELERLGHAFRNDVKQLFVKEFVGGWQSLLAKHLQAGPLRGTETLAAKGLKHDLGVEEETAQSLLMHGTKWKKPLIENYLAAVTVYKVPWDQLDVANRRENVIAAMCQTLVFIQRRRSDETFIARGEISLNRTEWELLCRVFNSSLWVDAVAIAEESERQQALLQVAASIIQEFNDSVTRPELYADVSPKQLIALVQCWLPAWVVFFAAVPFKWRF